MLLDTAFLSNQSYTLCYASIKDANWYAVKVSDTTMPP
jgi:hypothetical protein